MRRHLMVLRRNDQDSSNINSPLQSSENHESAITKSKRNDLESFGVFNKQMKAKTIDTHSRY